MPDCGLSCVNDMSKYGVSQRQPVRYEMKALSLPEAETLANEYS